MYVHETHPDALERAVIARQLLRRIQSVPPQGASPEDAHFIQREVNIHGTPNLNRLWHAVQEQRLRAT